MSGFFHPVYKHNALDEFLALRGRFDSEPPTFDGVLRMCQCMRAYGCFCLFMDYDAEMFNVALHASSRAFAFHLAHLSQSEQTTGRAAPFFDALACNDLAGAALIAGAASGTWNRNAEYEEDFLFLQFLFQLFFRPTDESACLTLLQRYENVIQGEADPRLQMATALLERDQELFEEALDDLIVRHEEHYTHMREIDAATDEELCSEGCIFIEGLAHVRLAAERGIPTQMHYRLMPSIVREDFNQSFAPDLWRQF